MSIPVPEMLYFTRSPLETVVATRPETGSAVIFNPKTNKWDYSDKDYYQIVADSNYDQISEEQAKSVYGDNLPNFGFQDFLDIIKINKMAESSKEKDK